MAAANYEMPSANPLLERGFANPDPSPGFPKERRKETFVMVHRGASATCCHAFSLVLCRSHATSFSPQSPRIARAGVSGDEGGGAVERYCDDGSDAHSVPPV
jgi:hypothetical protein